MNENNSESEDYHQFLPTQSASPATPRSTLPQPRSLPLRAGSVKETALIQYLEDKLLAISGRYERRFNAGQVSESRGQTSFQNGYESFGEVAEDLDGVIDVVWVSGTPTIQIPFLLNIALASSTYLVSFPYSPRRTFSLLRKLDIAFSSLLHHKNVETGELLPGFSDGRSMTMTEKVRLRGLIESTRVHITRAASGESEDGRTSLGEATEDDDNDDDYDDMSGTTGEDGLGPWEMELARVYELTIVDLGPSLDGASNVGMS